MQNCSDIFFDPDSPSLPLLYRNVIELQQRSSSISFLFQKESGKQCVSWYDLDLHFTSPNNDLERNACRNAMYNTLSNYGEGKPVSSTEVLVCN